MENGFKRFLSLAMAVLMVLTNVPVSVFATGDVPACAHENKLVETTEATCTQDGVIITTCEACSEVLSTETLPSPGHSYVDGKCSVCGEKEPDASEPEVSEPETSEPEVDEQVVYVQALINALPESFKQSEAELYMAQFEAANEAYAELTAEQKAQILNAEKLNPTVTADEPVIEPITGTITENMVWNDGDVIGGVTISGNVTITVKGTVTVNGTIRLSSEAISNVVFEGEESAKLIRGSEFTGQMFYAEGVSGNFQNLTFNNITLDGGAVWTGDVDKTLNRGKTNEGVKATGSVLYLVYANAKLNNSVLQNHDDASGEKANAVFLRYYSTIEFNSSVVRNNNSVSSYYRGGVITVRQGGTAKTNNAEVYGNSGVKGGFYGTSSTGSYGGVVEATASKFHNNYAGNGAVFDMQCNSNRGYLKIDGCEFYENASECGLIYEYAYSRPVIIKDSYFHDNECAVWDCHADPVLDISGKIVIEENSDYTGYLFETPLVLTAPLADGSSIPMNEATLTKLGGTLVTGSAVYDVTEADQAKFDLPEDYKVVIADMNGDGIGDVVAVNEELAGVTLTLKDAADAEASAETTVYTCVTCLPVNPFSHEGLTFAGWKDADGKLVTKKQFTEAATLTAIWKIIAPTVKLSREGATLKATVTNASEVITYTYQWYMDNVAIEGATAATYTMTDMASHSYKCVVTASMEGFEGVTGSASGTSSAPAIAQIGDSKYASLKDAVNAANAIEGGATITLMSDVTVSEKLTIKKNVTIEGAHTITRADNYTGTLFVVNAGATLTLDNGLVIDGGNEYVFDKRAYEADLANYSTNVASSTKWFTPEADAPVATAYMITTTGGTVNLNDVTIQNSYSTNSGVISAGANSTIALTGAKVMHVAATNASGVVVHADGKGIQVTVNNGTVIDGNHVGGNHGLFKVYSGAVMTMNGGVIKNTTGWNSNGVVVGLWGSGSTFIMNGGEICSNSSVYGPNNGRNAAIYLHSSSAMVMNGGTICHNSGRSRGGIDSANSSTKLTINGGYILGNISISNGTTPDVGGTAGTFSISDGTFTQDVTKWLAPGVGLCYIEEEGVYTVSSALAEVNGKSYASVAEAIAAAGNGDTVKLLGSHKPSETIVINKNITLDMNGMSLLGYSDVNPIVRVLADVTVTGNGMIDSANQGDGYCFIVGNGEGVSGNLTINNGTFKGTTTAVSVTKGKLTIKDGDFRVKPYEDSYQYLLNCIDSNYKDGTAVIEVMGGKFTNFDPANNEAEGKNTSFMADGYETQENNGVYTVVKSIRVAKIGEVRYASLTAAIGAANAGDEITFLADITEDVDVNKNVTINGAGKIYTGKMTLTANKDTVNIKNVNFDGKGYTGYAVEARGVYYVTIEDCTAKSYGYGFLQQASATVLTTVKNVTVNNMNYGVKIDHGNAVVLENVDISVGVAAVLNSNYGEKTITIKDSKLNILGTWKRNDTIKTTYVFEGANTVGKFITEAALDTFKLADVNSTLTAPEGQTVTTDVDDYKVVYENGVYQLAEKAVKVTVTVADATMVEGNAQPAFTYTTDVEVPALNITYTVDGTTINATVAEMDGYEFTVVPGKLTVEQALVRAYTADNAKVKYFTSLNEALQYAAEQKDYVPVYVLTNITVNETIVFNDKSANTIELQAGNKTITATMDEPFLKLEAGRLSVKNVVIDAKGDAFYVTGGELSLNYHSKGKQFIEVTSRTGNCIYIRGGNVNVNGAKLTSLGDYPAIQGNGSYAGNVTLTKWTSGDGTYPVISAPNADMAIYWPQNGKLTVEGGKITGSTALYAKSGTIVINGGEFIATGEKVDFKHYSNGAYATGDAVVIEACVDAAYETPSVTVTGGTFTSANANGLMFYNCSGAANAADIMELSGGTYSGTLEKSWCKEGYIPDDNRDGTCTVREEAFLIIHDKSMVAGNAVPEFTYEIRGADITNIDIEFVYEADGKTAGEFEISAIAKDLSGEYGFTIVPGTLTVQKAVAKASVDKVTTFFTTLQEAYNKADSRIDVLDHIVLTETLKINREKSGMSIYMNGKNLSGDLDTLIEVDTKGKTFSISSAAEITNTGDVFYVKSGNLNIYGECTITSEKANCVYTRGGSATIQKAILVANGEYPAIQGNGMYSGNVTIQGGSVSAPKADMAIYWPQNGTLTVSNGTVTGATALYVKSGTIVINGGEFIATGAKADFAHNSNGATATGDAVVIEACVDAAYETPSVTIKGGTFTSENANGLMFYDCSGKADAADILEISGGTYTNRVSSTWCAEGYLPVSDAAITNGWTVMKAEPVASIGEELYANLADAVKDAAENSEIVMLEDIQVAESMLIDKTVTLNLNGCDIEAAGVLFNVSGHLILKDGSDAADGTIDVKMDSDNNATAVNLSGGGFFTMESGNIYAEKKGVNSGNKTGQGGGIVINGGTITTPYENVDPSEVECPAPIFVNKKNKPLNLTINGGTLTGYYVILCDAPNSTINITGGNLQHKGDDGFAVKVTADNVKTSITGGTFTNDVQDYCAEGYAAVNNGDGTWTVREQINVTITVDNTTMVAGNELPAFTYTTNVDVEGLNVKLSTTADGKTVGEFEITAEVIEPTDAKYVYTIKAGKLTVEQALVRAYAKNNANAKYFADLKAAVEFAVAQKGNVPVYLLSNVTINETIVVNDTNAGLVELQGDKTGGQTFTLTSTHAGEMFKVEKGTLSVKNLKINANGDAFYVTGGTLNLNYHSVGKQFLEITSRTGNCIYIRGGNVSVNGAKLTSLGEYPAIQGNGSYAGNVTITKWNIGDGTYPEISAPNTDMAIYWPQNGNLTVEGGKITGKTALYAKSGNIVINGGEFIATGEKVDFKHYSNGAYATGDAVVIEACVDAAYEIPTVTVTGGTFTSENANGLMFYDCRGKADAADILEISGGTYSGTLEKSWCKEGYIPDDNRDGTCTVREEALLIIQDKSMVAGNAVPEFTYEIQGADITNIEIEFVCKADGKTAGEFEISAIAKDPSGKYGFTIVPGKLTVEAAMVRAYAKNNANVRYFTDLKEAVEFAVAQKGNVPVYLLSNITINETIVVNDTNAGLVELQGDKTGGQTFTLTSTHAGEMFKVEKGTLAVKNLKINAEGDAFCVTGGTLNLNYHSVGKQFLEITSQTGSCIDVCGGTVNVNGAKLTSLGGDPAIQGNSNCAGNVTITKWNISDGTYPEISAPNANAAISWPQNGTLTIEGGSISGGEIGLLIENNTQSNVIINGGTITAESEIQINGANANLTVKGNQLTGANGAYKPDGITCLAVNDNGWTLKTGNLTMVDNDETGDLTISNGCSINLNGKNLTAENVTVFGTLIDTTDGTGSVVAEKLWFNNHDNGGYMPLKDGNCYRLFATRLWNRGVKVVNGNPDKIKVGFSVVFKSVKAYDLLIESVKDGTITTTATFAGEYDPAIALFSKTSITDHLLKARNSVATNSEIKNAVTGTLTIEANTTYIFAELISETNVIIVSETVTYTK